MNVVHEIISESLKRKISLMITEKTKEKYNKNEIENLTRQHHNGIKTGNNDVDNVMISISLDMDWQKKEPGILTI